MQVRPRLTLPKTPPAPQQQPDGGVSDGGGGDARDQQDDDGLTHHDEVTVPAATWQRMRQLAELGERVEKGEFKQAAVVDEAVQDPERHEENPTGSQCEGFANYCPQSDIASAYIRFLRKA